MGRGKPPSPYKSWFEHDIHQKLGKKWKYEPTTFQYTVPLSRHWYTPDFVKGDEVYETKGKFTASDRKKTLLFVEQHPEVRFSLVFQNPNNPIRKGSKTTYADWCNKHNISWIDGNTILT